MSHQHAFQLFDRNVFESGPYLRAFDGLVDIDAHEHSILTYIGSLLPIGKGVINEPVSPSIPAIARATKMSVSTVRRRIQSLEGKGYLIVQAVHYKNLSGKNQQGANSYCLTPKTFDAYLGILPFAEKREDDESAPAMKEESKPISDQVQKPLKIAAVEVTSVTPSSHRHGFSDQELVNSTAADRVLRCWTNATGLPVAQVEMESFRSGFENRDQSEDYYYVRIQEVAADPMLKRIAKNINFLLLPREHEKICDQEPGNAEVKELAEDNFSKIKTIGQTGMPVNQKEILDAIDQRMSLEIAPELKARLAILREAVPRCKLEVSLSLFRKHVQPIPI